jgi:hypothetical protein
MSGVRFNVKAAVVFRTTVAASGGSREAVQESDGANEERQRVALWREIITAWSFADKGIPIPSQNVAGAEVIWSTLDDDDFDELAEATQGLLDRMTATPTSRKNAKTSSTS